VAPSQPRLGELLVEARAITRAQLEQALHHQRTAGGRLGTNLVELGFIDEKTLSSLLAAQLRIPSATASQIDRADPRALELLTAQAAERLRAVPLRLDNGKLWIAMAEPTDRDAAEELQRLTGKPVRTMVAPELLIQYALERHYRVRRRPRAVQVHTIEADLLEIERDGAKVATPPPPAAAYPAPVAVDVSLDMVTAATGFLDERPAPPRRRATLREISERLASAPSDDAVIDVAIDVLAEDAARLVLLVLAGDRLTGWRGRNVAAERVAAVNVALAEVPRLAQSLASGQAYVGALYAEDLGGMARALELPSQTLGVVLPVRVGTRALGLMVAVEVAPSIEARQGELDRLAQKLDHALHIRYLRRQLLQD
jgi:hypothetical protein